MADNHAHYEMVKSVRGLDVHTYGVVVRDEKIHEAADELMQKLNDHTLEVGEEASCEIRIEAILKTYPINYEEQMTDFAVGDGAYIGLNRTRMNSGTRVSNIYGPPEKDTYRTKWQRILDIIFE